MEMLRREAQTDQSEDGPRARFAALLSASQGEVPSPDDPEPQRPKLDPATWGMDQGAVDWAAVTAAQGSQ